MSNSLKRGAKSSAAMNWVREQILSGALATGEIVRPEDVGTQLGISATPAREALQALRTEGFLESKPGVGFVVATLSTEDIQDIFMMHAYLAGELTARAVQHASDTDIDELEALHYELLAASRRNQAAEVEDRNHQFHRRITYLGKSPKLAQMLGLVSRYVPRSFYSEVGGWTEASRSDHEAIIHAFRNRDPEAGRQAMADHMTHAGRLLASQFQSAITTGQGAQN